MTKEFSTSKIDFNIWSTIQGHLWSKGEATYHEKEARPPFLHVLHELLPWGECILRHWPPQCWRHVQWGGWPVQHGHHMQQVSVETQSCQQACWPASIHWGYQYCTTESSSSPGKSNKSYKTYSSFSWGKSNKPYKTYPRIPEKESERSTTTFLCTLSISHFKSTHFFFVLTVHISHETSL